MTQEQWIVLALKIVCVAAWVSLVTWVIEYSILASAWRNPIGRTLMTKSLLLAALLTITTLSLFFNFNRQTSEVAGWLDVALIGAIAPVMWWRIVVWWKISRQDAP